MKPKIEFGDDVRSIDWNVTVDIMTIYKDLRGKRINYDASC